MIFKLTLSLNCFFFFLPNLELFQVSQMSQHKGTIIKEKTDFWMVVLFLLGVHACIDILVLHYVPFLTLSATSSHFHDFLKHWTEYHLWAGAKGQQCHFVIRFSNLWAKFNNRVLLYLQHWLFLAIHLFLLLLTCKNRLTTPRYLGNDAGVAGCVILYLQGIALWMRAQIGTQCPCLAMEEV